MNRFLLPAALTLALAGGRLAAAPYGAAYYDTSEYLAGSISVNIIFPESAGGGENWSSARKTDVRNRIGAAMSWWAAREPAAKLTFVYNVRDVSVSDEPITCNADPASVPATSCDEPGWVGEAMTNLGYPGTDYYDQVYAFNNAMRALNGTDWSFTIIVADSLNDADGEFPDGYFAYSYLGGPFTMITYDNSAYGIGNLAAVAAHETGHVFYALDEYSASNCSTGDYAGYLNGPNSNCENGGTNYGCIMRGQVEPYSTPAICAATRRMLGWRDSNSNGVLDITELPPTTVLTPYLPDPSADNTPTYYGMAHSTSAYTNSNPYDAATSHHYYQAARNNMSVLKIAAVEYNIDGGAWQQASPRDSGFDQTIDSFTFTTAALSDGARLIRARAKDNFGNYDPAPPSDSLTVNTLQPTDIPYVQDGTGSDIDYVSSLNTLSANWGASSYLSGVDHYEYCIGTTPGGQETAAWTSAGQNLSVTRAGLGLSEGTVYYFGVRAVGTPGPVYSGVTVSDGQRVDTISPTARVEINSALPARTGALNLKLIITEANGLKSGTVPGLTFAPAGGAPRPVALTYLVSSTWTGTAFIESYYSTGTASFVFTSTDVAGNRGSAITAGSTFLINTAVSGITGGIVTNSDNARVTVPAGAYPSGDLIITISTVSAARTARADAAFSEARAVLSTDLTREFLARTPAGVPVTSFSSPLALQICYPDADSDGRIDGDFVQESLSGFYLLDESASKWTRVSDSSRDTAANCLGARVSHFSVYSVRVFDSSQFGMDKLKAFPNPCYFDRGSRLLTIRGIPVDAEGPEIYIYNVAGELVRTLKPGDGIDPLNKEGSWNGREKSGARAASGLYIYLVKTANHGKATGKFYIFW